MEILVIGYVFFYVYYLGLHVVFLNIKQQSTISLKIMLNIFRTYFS